MFSCCHPAISEDGQTALILRLVCGFGLHEVAHAFLADPTAMEKRLVRAKRALVADGRLIDVTAPSELRDRLPSVRSALNLLFDAGYHGSLSPHPVCTQVCLEAIHLSQLMVETPATADPETHALLALMCLHAARLPARVNADGGLVPLDRQDRSRWDRALIERGMQHLSASAAGEVLSAYHLEGGIAAQHAVAESVDDTNWPEIVRLYDLLYARKRTPVVGLGRAIAPARIAGPIVASPVRRVPVLTACAPGDAVEATEWCIWAATCRSVPFSRHLTRCRRPSPSSAQRCRRTWSPGSRAEQASRGAGGAACTSCGADRVLQVRGSDLPGLVTYSSADALQAVSDWLQPRRLNAHTRAARGA